MVQLFIPDFIKNRMVQLILVIISLMDIAASGTLKHMLILFGLPYLASIALFCLINPRKSPIKPRVSEQYRPYNNKKNRR
ncbi:hypothetical protein Lmor_0133 [Legionella moravica]|uniref:Uncharacterized protein n=1 Tax=Legionella moravica TaxID=39962 RepID=A0A378JYF1_9GAMM|nr:MULTISPECIES: hypothetical protein [Legionella]KTD39482.1 hypothetical protein Lmor_0133 [Legionella moravica]RUR17841.1 hypothetical protein ELY21_10080 [Legionella sp. km535]STX63735.1 Uncharacterised protein [Legionella moravica]